jgi:hypothetical protein
VRSFPLAAAAVLLGLIVVSGCDAADLDATDLASSAAPTSAPATSAGTSAPATSAAPSRKPAKATSSAAPTTSAPAPTGTPSPTAMATDTAGGAVTGVPRSYADAAAHLKAVAGTSYHDLARFSTPGDSIYCVLQDPYVPVSCELRTGAIRDPGVCGQSMSDSVGRIQLGDDGAVPQCNTDTIREPGAKVVGPPALVDAGNIECAVEKIGVTCVNTRTHGGFFLTPGKYATFSH